MAEFNYITDFYLKNDVLDVAVANDYLHEDDMTNYLKNEKKFENISDIFVRIKWSLVNERRGFIELITTRELTKEESKEISKWINGQCSDGLGEGFEQQSFACYTEKEETIYNLHKNGIYSLDLGSGEDEPDDDYLITCSFDWENNNYELRLVK